MSPPVSKLSGTGPYARVALELLIKTGFEQILLDVRSALYSALWVPHGTVLENAQLMERAETDKLKEHWKGRFEAAKSIVRHLDRLEPILWKVYRLVPPRTPAEQSAVTELKESLARTRRVMKTGKYEPRKKT